MVNLCIYESLKNVDDYVDYTDNIEFEYRYKYDFITEASKRNYRNIVLRSLIQIYNKDSENLKFPETEYPISSYMGCFVNSVRGIVSENILPKEWVEKFTKNTILNSKDKKEVQIALALGEYFLADNLVEEVSKVFSKSGDYITYVIGVIKRMQNYNTFLFDLIKNSKGMIKFIAAENIEEVDMKITKYMLTEGYKDDYYGDFMAGLVINLFNCSAYLLREDITTDEVNKFCKLFVDFFRSSGPAPFTGDLDFLDAFLYNIEKYGDSIEALYCIFAIKEIVLEDKTIEIDEKEFSKGIKSLASQKKFKTALKNALAEGEFELSDLMFMAENIEMNINLKKVKKFLEKDAYNPEIYRSLLECDTFLNHVELVEYAEENLDFSDIVGKMEGISLRDERELNKKEEILDLILSELDKVYPVGVNLLKMGMDANSTRIRRKTSKVLLKLKKQLPNDFVDYIVMRFSMEIIPEVKKNYEKIINRDVNKKIEKISVEDIKVDVNSKDIYVLDTYIAGLAYRDKDMLEKEIRENARFYMKRDISNLHDIKAIKIVSKSGHVVGFVPKKDNEIISRLMDSGKYFYCIINEVDMDRLHVDIEIYMSYKDVMMQIDQVARALSLEPKKNRFN